MNSKHIFIISSEFPPQPGGIGNHAFNLAGQLSRKNFKVSLLTDYRSSDLRKENEHDEQLNFEIIRIQRYNFIFKTYIRRFLSYRKFIKKERPDVVIASGKFPLWLVAFGRSKPKLKKIAVIHGSEVNLKVKWQRKLTDLALKRFHRIIAVSNNTRSLIKHLELDSVNVIPNGFDLQKFNIEHHEEAVQGSPSLITVGNISERKGQHLVIQKLPYLLKTYPDIHYHMVGISSEKAKFLELAKSLAVEKHLTFHGVVSQARLVSLLSKSDIFVMLSEETKLGEIEGFGIAFLEANFMGLPAIGSKNCGIEDAINNYRSGILVDAKSISDFNTALSEILEHRDSYKMNAKEWALEHTWEQIVEHYIKLINL